MAVDKSNQRVQRMFGEIAPRYDLMNHLLSMNVDRYWRWRTVRLAPPESDLPILDVCTGTGDLALAFHRQAGGKAKVIGADFCREMLAVGEQKKQKAGLGEEVTFVEADTQNLPFEDNRFQIVSVAFGLRNVADTARGLEEMVRVCAPGGKVVVLEFSLPRWQPFKGIYGWYFRNVLPRIGQLFARNRQDAYNYLPESVGEFPCGEALAKQMRAAGLEEVWFRPFTLGVATLYVGVKPGVAEPVPSEPIAAVVS
ncbi:bifunctional demethylmenaquinone methyltransferase/2-methoxy-6-polyprenyl-1,4-benzoquinol methylase UbiE [Lignipirellula cremea]|uniref:Demethylmenaquinone methyltransferase n=1 Tax=Lignipirellula cremea TaxID=2528010 RepID=A0A518DRE4_9BACT|nr:bifunctional demethylmenaquinone methyltransferase/2-methoxy-6-polyprenyl-1,4-benzoquinol methylase UbiE [Lignipirellula cremea]QDU94420.1 UbiE/COQ5 methyltransferase [Lignipirellula cremea]